MDGTLNPALGIYFQFSETIRTDEMIVETCSIFYMTNFPKIIESSGEMSNILEYEMIEIFKVFLMADF